MYYTMTLKKFFFFLIQVHTLKKPASLIEMSLPIL